MNFKKALEIIVDFCTNSPFEREKEETKIIMSDIQQMKLVKIFQKQKDYYMTRIINDGEMLAMELARKDLMPFLNDNEHINEIYDKLKISQI